MLQLSLADGPQNLNLHAVRRPQVWQSVAPQLVVESCRNSRLDRVVKGVNGAKPQVGAPAAMLNNQNLALGLQRMVQNIQSID